MLGASQSYVDGFRENDMGNEQILASSIAFAGHEVAAWTQHPVQGEAASSKALVGVVCGVFAIAPILDVELLALTGREESEDSGKHKLC